MSKQLLLPRVLTLSLTHTTHSSPTLKNTMSPLFPFFLLVILPTFSLSIPYPYSFSLHIDCGGLTNSTDVFNTTWVSDRYYSGGAAAVVSEPLHFDHQQEKTLRYFPISFGQENCYSIPDVPPGKYFVRTFTVYDNYDGKSHSPSFDVAIEGTLVFSWRSPWPESNARSGAYSDLFVSISDTDADVCFYSIATDSPVIGSLELIQVDQDAYILGNDTSFNSSILVNYGRITSGSGQWGPGFSNDTDRFGRSWQSDAGFLTNANNINAISATKEVINVDRGPNYFPMKLYQTATILVSGGNFLEYQLPVDAKLDYLLWFHFAEIDVSVTKEGQRVFDVVVNGLNVSRVDIYKSVGGFAAYDWSYVVKNLSSTMLNVRLYPVVGSPTICGIENYAIVPADLKTVPDQASAMRALKESLRIPDRMGWNGDPCAPTTWDAWEGVTCSQNKESALVISRIDLGSQGLKGYLSDQIELLTNLVSLNLSSNSLGGSLPSGLGQNSLAQLDLSDNKFTGPIPDSLTSSQLRLVLLNGNQLSGRVPEELYSIGVHGGAIDLSGNKGLCGVPSLPDCPLFWGKDGLSTGGKVAIGLSCLVIFCLLLLVIHICIKRRRNDYDFALPQELTSLAAKRNRYQRQKSLMALEMESQHAKGFIPTYNANGQAFS